MVLLKVHDYDDVKTLPLTKWNIRQPLNDGSRENAFDNGMTIKHHRIDTINLFSTK